MKYLFIATCLLLSAGGLFAQKKYDKGSRFVQGYARIEDQDRTFYIDRSGKTAFDTIYNNMTLTNGPVDIDSIYLPQDIVVVGLKGKMGVMTVLGKWLLQPIYDTIDTQSVEAWMVRKDNKTSYYTPKGFLMPFRFEGLENLDDHYFAVQEKGKWGIYNKDKDQLVVPYTYEEMDYCFGCNTKGDYVLAKLHDKWGVVNFKNEVLLPFQYDHEHMNMRSDEWVESFYQNNQKLSINLKTKKVEIDTCQCLPLEVEDDLDTELGTFKGQRRNGKWGLVNPAGKLVLDHQYDDISYDSSNLIGVMRGDKYGVMDTTGKVIIPVAYDSWFRSICAGKLLQSDQNGIEVLFDANGKRILTQYHRFDEMRMGDGPPLLSIIQGQLYGLYNPYSGKLVPPKYSSISYYSNPHNITVTVGSKYGVIDSDGNVVVPAIYTNLAANEISGQPQLVYVTLKEKLGIYDTRQQKLIAPIMYDYITNYNDTTVISLLKGDHYGLIDFAGNTLAPVKYKTILYVDSVYVLLQETDSSTVEVLNKQTRTIYKMPYDTAAASHEGRLMLVRDKNRCFLFDIGKKAIVEGEYSQGGYPEAVGLFEHHRAKVVKNGKLGWMDANGNYLVKPAYTFASEFADGVAAVFNLVDSATRTFVYGYIDSTGKEIVPVTYEVPSINAANYSEDDFILGNGMLAIMKDGFVGLADHTGKLIIPARYDQVMPDKDGNGYLVKRDNKFGIIDADGKEILKPEYDDVVLDQTRDFYNTVGLKFPMLVKKGDRLEYIDERGKPIGLTVEGQIEFSTLDWGEAPIVEPVPPPPVVPQ